MNTKSNILVAIAIIAVGSVSFISGRLSVDNKNVIERSNGLEQGMGIVKTEASETGNAISSGEVELSTTTEGKVDAKTSTNGTADATTGAFIASKAGEKYFPITCGSAKTIKPENAIYFKTAAEAEGTGRTKSTRCKY